MITSPQNIHIKELKKLAQKKYLKQSPVFPIEGKTMLQEALQSSCIPQQVYVAQSFVEEFQRNFDLPFITISDRLMQSLSATISGRELIACMEKGKEIEMPAKPKGKFIYLQDLQDPGNMGTIFRSAEAFGFDGVLVSPNSVYMYNDKVVRGSMGSIFRIPHRELDDDGLLQLHERGYGLISCAPRRGEDNKFQKEGLILVIGNESAGVNERILETSDSILTIPMQGKVESLNAGVAASIAMYIIAGED